MLNVMLITPIFIIMIYHVCYHMYVTIHISEPHEKSIALHVLIFPNLPPSFIRVVTRMYNTFSSLIPIIILQSEKLSIGDLKTSLLFNRDSTMEG